MRWKRLPAEANMYRRTNRAHLNIYILYITTIGIFFILYVPTPSEGLADLAVGTYIYFTLYYAFLFPLIGLAKNSISVNLLATINNIEKEGRCPTKQEVSIAMSKMHLGAADLRESRLYQLTYLGLAQKGDGDSYTATPLGSAIHFIGEKILSIWKQSRL